MISALWGRSSLPGGIDFMEESFSRFSKRSKKGQKIPGTRWHHWAGPTKHERLAASSKAG
jgi:hypothetical protein